MENSQNKECSKCKKKICSTNIKLHELQCNGNLEQANLSSI